MPSVIVRQPDRAGVRPTAVGPVAFHAALPGYAPTPAVALPAIAAELGIAGVVVKDESARLGLPAFKVLGASWAIARAIGGDAPPADLTALAASARACGITRVVAATDGNHGRAVARLARLAGLTATIYVPEHMVAARRDALLAEGAELVAVADGYDAAVALSATQAGDPGCLVANDADADGVSRFPTDVIDGYATLFAELDDQLAAPPTLLILQAGVGALAAAGTRWAAARGVHAVVVEPERCACIVASLAAGAPVTIVSAGTTMAGLDCPTPSTAAWPDLAAGLTGALAIPDRAADEASRALHAAGVVSGESGAAGLAGLLALARDPACAPLRDAVGWSPATRAVVISTEGATDPERYAHVLADG